jgi:hypothetical protein
VRKRVLLLLPLCILAGLVRPQTVWSQKVKVDYDKSIDFAKYKSYSWGQLEPARMPLFRLHVIGAIDEQLQAKGLVKVEQNPDLMVTCAGALDQEFNQSVSAPTYPGYAGPPPTVNSTMWTGSGGSGGSYPKGSLVVELMDPHAAKIAWRATGTLKVDMEKKTESLTRVNDVVSKMFVRYPPHKE